MTEIEAMILAKTVEIQYKLLGETSFVVNELSELQQQVHYKNLIVLDKHMSVWIANK